MNLHPGAAAALRRLSLDELGIAREIAAGELASPQRYENVSLFNVRVTGTGVSYRPTLDEFVYRLPENYLTPDFLARCNGLSVVFVHPVKNLLTSEEFNNRIVGAVMLPYIRGEEVWAVCRIYDDETIALLGEERMSTSPAVLLGTSQKYTDDQGNKIIVEGKPKLLDHLAIVSRGVWDKGGEATGIEANIRGDSAMADKTKEEMEREDAAKRDSARADADKRMDETLSKVLDGIGGLSAKVDACNQRMDAWDDEKKKSDKSKADADEEERKADKAKIDAARRDGEDDETVAKRLAADKAKKDAEDEDEKKKADKAKKDAEDEERKKADAARADSLGVNALKDTIKEQGELIKALAARIPKDMTSADMGVMTSAQARADSVFVALGDRAPVFLNGESPLMYRRRMAAALKKFSPRWKDVDLDAIRADAFENVEGQVYADAMEAARNPDTVAEGQLRCVTKVLPSGHRVNEYVGNPRAWMDEIAGPVRQHGTGSFKTGSAH